MTILGIKFSLAKPKRKDHLIVCFIAIVIITIIDISCISIRKSSEPFKTIYHKNSPNSLSILTRLVTAFLPSYLPFKNSSVQCRRCTYPFFLSLYFWQFFHSSSSKLFLVHRMTQIQRRRSDKMKKQKIDPQENGMFLSQRNTYRTKCIYPYYISKT